MSQSKNIFITGTSSGFGYGATKALAQRGHTVFATMRGVAGKNEAQATLLRQWAEAGGHKVHVLELDVTSDASVKAAVDTVIAKVGKIDVLVNNAGVGTWGIQEAFTVEQVHAMFEVNVYGVLRMNRAVLPHMRKAGEGYVIYLSSGLGRIVLPFLGPYTASKFAVEALAETASYELAPLGIGTTILQPGAYGTNFLSNSIQPREAGLIDQQPKVKAMFDAFGKGFEERAKAGQLGNPNEIFDAVVELVDMEKSKRPLRLTVGADVQQAVVPINEKCAEVQGFLLHAFGLR
jgi:NAD(P)-dependent dehydrogenase (short-subunit alcohol dehydrogenase family)